MLNPTVKREKLKGARFNEAECKALDRIAEGSAIVRQMIETGRIEAVVLPPGAQPTIRADAEAPPGRSADEEAAIDAESGRIDRLEDIKGVGVDQLVERGVRRPEHADVRVV